MNKNNINQVLMLEFFIKIDEPPLKDFFIRSLIKVELVASFSSWNFRYDWGRKVSLLTDCFLTILLNRLSYYVVCLLLNLDLLPASRRNNHSFWNYILFVPMVIDLLTHLVLKLNFGKLVIVFFLVLRHSVFRLILFCHAAWIEISFAFLTIKSPNLIFLFIYIIFISYLILSFFFAFCKRTRSVRNVLFSSFTLVNFRPFMQWLLFTEGACIACIACTDLRF